MSKPTSAESLPLTYTVVDESFKRFFQEVSGYDEALEVRVNNDAILEAVTDSGLDETTCLIFAFDAKGNAAHIATTKNDTLRTHTFIAKGSPILRSEEVTKRAIQTDILSAIATFADEAGVKPRKLVRKMKPPLWERIKYKSRLLGEFATGAGLSAASIETLAAGSSTTVKGVSVIAAGGLAVHELKEQLNPPNFTDTDTIDGYPPFIMFEVKDQ